MSRGGRSILVARFAGTCVKLSHAIQIVANDTFGFARSSGFWIVSWPTPGLGGDRGRLK
jgi:hypothetical protein